MHNKLKVKDLPLDSRPREKLLEKGPQALSDAELIAILLRTGSKELNVIDLATLLIKEKDGLANLAAASVESILKIAKGKGIGKDKAATLLAAFEISRRIKASDRLKTSYSITSPELISKFIAQTRDLMKEAFFVVCLNSANKVIKTEKISEGSLDASIVHPREVFKVAIESSAKSIILVHNHPSGSLQPSNEDINVTRKLIEAGKILEIKVLDHIIIAGESYFSFFEMGVVFEK